MRVPYRVAAVAEDEGTEKNNDSSNNGHEKSASNILVIIIRTQSDEDGIAGLYRLPGCVFTDRIRVATQIRPGAGINTRDHSAGGSGRQSADVL